ncbi:MAG: GNAT family N-acetyltransferase [Lachnospiraceae bacterium]|nr:GNAT family N-acetyltransferase [Lachnospiraceae bacterium]
MGVTLRKIRETDLETIMHWRMDPEITRYMNTDPKLTLEGQRKWLAAVESNPDLRYWMILVDGQEAGVINLTGLTREDGVLGWAYYVGEKRLRSLKTAVSLEMSLYDYIFDSLHKEALISDVFSLNRGVIQLHLLCGCEIMEEKKSHVCKGGKTYDVTFMRMSRERWQQVRAEKKYERISFEETEEM